MPVLRILLCLLFALVTALPRAVSAQAQPGSAAGVGFNSSLGSWVPVPRRGYLGLSLGRSIYRADCGGVTFICNDTDRSVKLQAGSMLGDFWGVELGYLNMGRIVRAGGEARAQGLNFSLVGKASIGGPLGVFGKIGPTWSRTESLLPGSGIAAGSEHGFGLSYGAGVSVDFSPKLSATLEWESNDFRFGAGREPVRSTSLGLKYRY